VTVNVSPEKLDQDIHQNIFQHCEAIITEIERHRLRQSEEIKEKKKKFFQSIKNIFIEIKLTPIYIKKIPNGYMPNDPYFQLIPWFHVTTKFGPLIIGERKRVIVLDWCLSEITNTSEQIFVNEATTKFDKTIHCLDLEKLKEYLIVLKNHFEGSNHSSKK
jgi:hypothetical protein